MYQAWQAIEQRLDQANLLYPASSNLEKPMAIFATKPGSLEVQFFGAIEGLSPRFAPPSLPSPPPLLFLFVQHHSN